MPPNNFLLKSNFFFTFCVWTYLIPEHKSQNIMQQTPPPYASESRIVKTCLWLKTGENQQMPTPPRCNDYDLILHYGDVIRCNLMTFQAQHVGRFFMPG